MRLGFVVWPGRPRWLSVLSAGALCRRFGRKNRLCVVGSIKSVSANKKPSLSPRKLSRFDCFTNLLHNRVHHLHIKAGGFQGVTFCMLIATNSTLRRRKLDVGICKFSSHTVDRFTIDESKHRQMGWCWRLPINSIVAMVLGWLLLLMFLQQHTSYLYGGIYWVDL